MPIRFSLPRPVLCYVDEMSPGELDNPSADAEYGDVPAYGSLYPCLLKRYEDVLVLTSQRI